MRRISSIEELTAILDAKAPAAYARGILPPDVAPPGAVFWLSPMTLDKARALHVKQARWRGLDYTEADGHRAVLAAGILTDPASWEQEPDEHGHYPDPVARPAELVPVWSNPDELRDYGDPLSMGTLANQLVALYQDANGLAIPDETENAPRSFDAFRARVGQRVRWVAGLFAQDPDAALCVGPWDEAARFKAQEYAEVKLGEDKAVSVEIGALKPILAGSIRDSAGKPFLDLDTVGRLPYGAARTLYYVAYSLTAPDLEGRSAPAVRFLGGRAAAGPPPARRGRRACVVDSREAAPAAVGDGGGDDHGPAGGDGGLVAGAEAHQCGAEGEG